ncbi:hypothetical protein B296_00010733 [Ensete ventricosum]|uniref:Uncharacterized protein n=1 Tax=Ensete ventricosum TaxID=4639 RepID=A0A426ZGC3_ENSVE|nr:hypothetical protein B296_00010733 [Ensete ventricosum]
MRTYNLELVKQLAVTNERVMSTTKQVRGLREELKVEQYMIPKYQRRQWSIIRRPLGLEGVISYQFRYQITLASFKARYPKLEFDEDLFTDYPRGLERLDNAQGVF